MQQKNLAFLNSAAEDFGIVVLRIKKQVRITLSFKVIGSLITQCYQNFAVKFVRKINHPIVES